MIFLGRFQFAREEFSVLPFGVSSSIAVTTHRDGPRTTSGKLICRSAMLLTTPNEKTENSLRAN